MKKIISVFCFTILMFAAGGCSHNSNKGDKQQVVNDLAITNAATASPADSAEQNWNSTLDSMLRVATTAKQDTNLAKLYFDIGEVYLNEDHQKAKEYYLKLRMLSEEINWYRGYYLFAAGFTDILNREGLMDSSIVIHQQTLELVKEEMDELLIAKILTNTGNCYYYKKWFQTALKYYNDALPFFEKRGEKYILAHLYSLIGSVHREMNMQNENMMYCEKAVNILNEKPDTLPRIDALINYAVALSDNWQLENAEQSLLEAQRISILHNNRYRLISIYSNLGNLALKKYDWNNMEIYARKALELTLEFGEVEGYCISNRSLAYVEEYRRNFDKSEKYVMEALEAANEFDLPTEKMKCYYLLSNLATARHNFHDSRIYENKADSVQITIISEQTRLYAKEMEAKYETEKKDIQITALEDERRLMIWLGIAGGLVSLLALTAAISLWRWAVQRKHVAEQQHELAETRIKQLEQEKQLVATQAVLDGETRERARLARDLHDSLGSILTGAKLNLLEFKKGATLDYVDVTRFDNALGLLDRSVLEMRRVAHHLIPDSLSRFGLKPAVSDFCSNLPSVKFLYYGDEARLDPNMEVMIYRTIHELVNNALKHAGAIHVMVQIIQEPDRIAFTVSDDGCGFDPSAATEGMGLHNIRTRVAS